MVVVGGGGGGGTKQRYIPESLGKTMIVSDNDKQSQQAFCQQQAANALQ